MRRIALDKAAISASAASDALRRSSNSDSYQQFSRSWSDFLTAFNRFYNALKVGKVVAPRSEKWYSEKEAERKKDPLLSYLFQARHADEHGVEPVILREAPSLTIGHGRDVFIENLVMRDGKITVTGTEDGKPITVRRHPEGARLVTVVNRGVSYPPPVALRQLRRFDDIASTVSPVISYMNAVIDDGRSYLID